MKKGEKVFFGSVLLGAMGVAFLLSPSSKEVGEWIVPFATEGIRAGMVLINVEIRKMNPSQYWVVLLLAVLATLGIAFAIDGMVERYSMEWWGGQVINFLVLGGEYSWAVLRAGVPIDWEMEALKMRGELGRVREELGKVRESEEELRVYEGKARDLEEKLRGVSEEMRSMSQDIETKDHDYEKMVKVVKTYLRHREKKVSVGGKKAKIHKCGRLVVAPNNSSTPESCECGDKIEW